MITLSNVGKFYGDQTLFAKVSLQLNAGERYGLVGANGSGKTTLLNMLSGDLEPSEGSITVPQRLRLGVLQQDQFLYEDESILNVALMGNAALWEVTSPRSGFSPHLPSTLMPTSSPSSKRPFSTAMGTQRKPVPARS